jgi:hypothetical protein
LTLSAPLNTKKKKRGESEHSELKNKAPSKQKIATFSKTTSAILTEVQLLMETVSLNKTV